MVFLALAFLLFFGATGSSSEGDLSLIVRSLSSLRRFLRPLLSTDPARVSLEDEGDDDDEGGDGGAMIGLILIDVTAGYSSAFSRVSRIGGEVMVRVSLVVGLVFSLIFSTVGGFPATVDADAVEVEEALWFLWW